jgi:hypothetical protein
VSTAGSAAGSVAALAPPEPETPEGYEPAGTGR